MTPSRRSGQPVRERPFGSRLLGPAGQSPQALRLRVQLLLTAFLVVTNLVGAGLVFLIASVVVPVPQATPEMTLALAVGVPLYVVVALTIGLVAGTVMAVRALRWVYAEEPPAEAERIRRPVVVLIADEFHGFN